MRRAILDYGKRNSVAHAGQRAEIRFHIADFDSITAKLDLLIDAALKEEQTVAETANVASAIGAPAAVFKKSGGCQFGSGKVTGAHIWSCNNDFAALIPGCRPVAVQQKDFTAWHHASHRKRRVSFQDCRVNANGSCGHSGFGWAVQIPNLRVRETFQ